MEYICIPVQEISLEGRIRKNMGDMRALRESMGKLGLLQPVLVSPEHRLIAGARRVTAAKELNWDSIPAVISESLKDTLDYLRAEQEENTCREPLAPSEIVESTKGILEEEKSRARERQREHGGTAPGKPSNTGGKFPPVKDTGKTRDRVAQVVGGMSGRTLERASAVVKAAEADPEKYHTLVEEMDRTGKVNGSFKKLKVQQKAEEIRAEPPPLPAGPFRVLVADPPWQYGSRANDPSHRSSNPYPSMSLEDIKAFSLPEMEADCILWLWTTNAHLPVSFDVLEAWGFEYKTCLTWEKTQMGTGDWLRGKTEHCLMAVRGKPVIVLTNQTTILHGSNREHSRKPEEFYAMVEALCPGAKVELFSRSQREGWAGHGAETTLFEVPR